MNFVLKVLVQMPDGSFQRLPIAKCTINGIEVVKHSSKKEARYWAEWALPSKLQIDEYLPEETERVAGNLREEGSDSSK